MFGMMIWLTNTLVRRFAGPDAVIREAAGCGGCPHAAECGRMTEKEGEGDE